MSLKPEGIMVDGVLLHPEQLVNLWRMGVRRIAKLEAKNASLREAATRVVEEKERQMDDVHRDSLRQFPHLLDDINRLGEVLQESE